MWHLSISKQVIDQVIRHLKAFLYSTGSGLTPLQDSVRNAFVFWFTEYCRLLKVFLSMRVEKFLDTASSKTGNSFPAALRVNTTISRISQLFGESPEVIDSFLSKVLPVAVQSRGLCLDQGWPNRGSRATCGSLIYNVRLAEICWLNSFLHYNSYER
jgi:hypothetical protein